MNFSFTEKNIKEIESILGNCLQSDTDSWVWKVEDSESKQSLMLSVYDNIGLGGNTKGCLISVQTLQGYFEIHDCKGYLILEPDEVIFLNADNIKVSCMIIGKRGTCSMYSNIKRELLNADFNELDPAVLLSAMQLSLTESMIVDL